MLDLVEVVLNCIRPNPHQARKVIRAENVERLAESIESRGLQQPPQARPKPDAPGHYELVFGHTRFAAYRLLHQRHPDDPRWARMPLYPVKLDDRQMFEAGMSENLDRADISCIERAQALRTYIQQFNATQRDCGKLFGLSQGAVSNLLRLLRLPSEVIDIVQQGILPERSARLLVTLPPEEAIRIARGAMRRPEEARADYVARCAREARLRQADQAGDAPSSDVAAHEEQTLEEPAPAGDRTPANRNGHGRLLRESSGHPTLSPAACPHCWKVPKHYARENGMWCCGNCGRPVKVQVLLAGAHPHSSDSMRDVTPPASDPL